MLLLEIAVLAMIAAGVGVFCASLKWLSLTVSSVVIAGSGTVQRYESGTKLLAGASSRPRRTSSYGQRAPRMFPTGILTRCPGRMSIVPDAVSIVTGPVAIQFPRASC
jgi:hypothetical protein